MKKAIGLASLLWVFNACGDNVDNFLNRAGITETFKRDRLEVMLRVLQEFNIDDRTLMYVFLEEINDESDPESLEECFECAVCFNKK
jgi:hypothetical protein